MNLQFGAIVVTLILVAAVLAVVWTPYDPTRPEMGDRLLPALRSGHLLGTDHNGRDIASMLMAGAQTTLLVSVMSVAVAMLIGVALTALAARFRGVVEETIMRGADVVYAFPAVLIAILFSASLGKSVWSAALGIAAAAVPSVVRVTRSAAIQVLETDYVHAAFAYGRGFWFVFARHVIPNIGAVLIVQATIAFGLAILIEASLAYLGIGAQPPTPSWGRMLQDSQAYLTTSPMLAIWPGLAIALSVLAFNQLGDGLRDVLDPKLSEDRRQ